MASKYLRSSKKTFQEKEQSKTDDEKLKALILKSKTKTQQNKETQASTKQPKEQATNKRTDGHSGMVLRKRGNKTTALKQFKVASSSTQLNKNLQVQEPLDSEISLNQNKKKSGCSPGHSVSSQSKAIHPSKLNSKPAKKILQSPSEDLPPDLCQTLSENVPENFMATNKKLVGQSGTILKKTGNKASAIKQLNVDSSQTQMRRRRNLQVKELLDSEISLKQKKSENTNAEVSGGIVKSQSKTINKSNLNLKSEKKILQSPSEDLPPDLCHTLLENVPEDFMMSPVKKTSHKGLKFVPNARKKSLLSFSINAKSEDSL